MLVQNKLQTFLNKVLNQTAKLRKGQDQLQYHCPFCKESKRIPKLEICIGQTEKFQSWHCWMCNSKGKSLVSLLKKLRSSKKYFVELYEIVKDESILKHTKSKTKQYLDLPVEFKPLYVPQTNPEWKNAFYYVKKRGLTRDDILRYNIGYCEEGEYKNCIIIPSYDLKGDLNYFIARSYYDYNRIKYQKCPYSNDIVGFELYVNWDEPLTIVEGVFDAFAVKKNVIPLFGKLLSSSLKIALIEYGVKRVNVCLDNDALKDAIHISEYLMSNGIEVHLVKLDKKDPSVLGFEAVNKIISDTPAMNEYDLMKLKLDLL